MKFEEVLGDLRQGRKIRRNAWNGQFRFIQYVDPTKYPQLDGDRESYQIMYQPAPEFPDSDFVPYQNPHDTEAEAKAELTKLKKSHTMAWNRFRKYQEAVQKSRGAPVKDVPYAPMPTDKENCFDDARIETRGVLSTQRLGSPFIVIVTQQNVMKIWSMTHDDILAEDWSMA